MRRTLRVLAFALAVACLAAWVLLGANRGWTKTTRTQMEKDPVTEIEFPKTEKHFSPGVELLGAGLLLSAAFLGTSFLFRQNARS